MSNDSSADQYKHIQHPMQPIFTDGNGVRRFKPNAIISHLFEVGVINLNKLAMLDFSNEDRQQFAQLLGYSVSGYSDLSYVDSYAYSRISSTTQDSTQEEQLKARIDYLENQIKELKKQLREPIAALFEIHPDDLG